MGRPQNRQIIILLIAAALLIGAAFWFRPSSPLIAVVPHHDLVKTERAELLNLLSRRARPKTILLLSPNHFDAGNGMITTSDQSWIIEGGAKKIEPDRRIVGALKESGATAVSPSAFDNEHGIRNILGDIAKSFPRALLVPIIIKADAGAEQVQKLHDTLSALCGTDCGVLASVDMSHYQPEVIAQTHDVKTLRALGALDEKQVWQAETDSPAALYFLMLWAKSRRAEHFNLFAHTNSGTIARNPDIETTTHIFGYYTKGPVAAINENICTFTFAGDSMFGRGIGARFQKNGFRDLFFNLGDRVFRGTDISWINLEGPISDHEVVQDLRPDNVNFNFSAAAAGAISYLKINAAGLANNHTINQGQDGLGTTRTLLENKGVTAVGDPNVVSHEWTTSCAGKQIALIAINTFADYSNATRLIIEKKTEGNFVIVVPHWGAEYQEKHSPHQEALAKEWVAAGAGLILGAHPHVIQDAQVIDGTPVFYSLGNFIFDQQFSEKTQRGLLIAGSLDDKKIKMSIVPIKSVNLKPELLRGKEKKQIIDKLCSGLPEYCTAAGLEIRLK